MAAKVNVTYCAQAHEIASSRLLGVVAHWRAARLQDAFRRLALSAGPPLSVLSDTDAGIPVNPDRAGGGTPVAGSFVFLGLPFLLVTGRGPVRRGESRRARR
jgi:hypothetical protein